MSTARHRAFATEKPLQTALEAGRFAHGVNSALDRGISHLRSLQTNDRYWRNELEANVTMPSGHLLLEQFLGTGDRKRWQKLSTYITGFPRDFMLKYHLYRNYRPRWALGSYRRLLGGETIHLPASDPWS